MAKEQTGASTDQILIPECWHVGIVVKDLDDVVDFYSRAFGWGPWRITAGAGRELEFTMVYLCAGNRPNIVDVGSFIPQQSPSVSGATR